MGKLQCSVESDILGFTTRRPLDLPILISSMRSVVKTNTQDLVILTPRACAKGKVIGSVLDTKIAQSRKSGVGQTALCHQTVENQEKLSYTCFKSLRTAHEHYESCVFTGCLGKCGFASGKRHT